MKKLSLVLLLFILIIFSGCQAQESLDQEAEEFVADIAETESHGQNGLTENYEQDPEGTKEKAMKELESGDVKTGLQGLSEIYYREGDVEGLVHLLDHYPPSQWRDYSGALHFLNELDPFVAQDYLYNHRDDMSIVQWAKFTEHVGYADVDDLQLLMEGRELSRIDQVWALYLAFRDGRYDVVRDDLDEEVVIAADYAWEETIGWEGVRYRTIVDRHHNIVNVLVMAKNDMGRLLIQNGMTGDVIEKVDYHQSKAIELYVKESPEGTDIIVENCVDKNKNVSCHEIYFYRWEDDELNLAYTLENPALDLKAQIVPDFNLVFSSNTMGKTVFQSIADEAEELIDRGFYYDTGQTAISEVLIFPVFNYDPYLDGVVATINFQAINSYSGDSYYFAENYLKLNYDGEQWQVSLLNPLQEAYAYDYDDTREELSDIDDEFIASLMAMGVHEMLRNYGTPDEMMYFDGGLYYIYHSYAGLAYYYDQATGISLDINSALHGEAMPMTKEEIYDAYPHAEEVSAEYDDTNYIYVDFGEYFAAFSDYTESNEYTCILYLKPLGT